MGKLVQMAPEQDCKAQVGRKGGRSLLPSLGSYPHAGHLGQVLHSSPGWYQQMGSLPEPVPQRGHLPVHGFCRLSDILQLPLQTPPASLCPRRFLLRLLQLPLELLQPEVAFLQLSEENQIIPMVSPCLLLHTVRSSHQPPPCLSLSFAGPGSSWGGTAVVTD